MHHFFNMPKGYMPIPVSLELEKITIVNSDSGSVNNNSFYEWTLCRGWVMNGLCVFWENMQNILYLQYFSPLSRNLRLKPFTINMNFISYIKHIKKYCIVWILSIGFRRHRTESELKYCNVCQIRIRPQNCALQGMRKLTATTAFTRTTYISVGKL